MAATQYQIIFNCTPTQFPIAINTTLTGVGYTSIQAPQKFQGTLIQGTGASANTGQIDFSYDGKAYLTFFGANMKPAMITELTTALAGTLGAPVPVNLAVPSAFPNLT